MAKITAGKDHIELRIVSSWSTNGKGDRYERLDPDQALSLAAELINKVRALRSKAQQRAQFFMHVLGTRRS